MLRMKSHLLSGGSALAHWVWRPYKPRKTLGEQVRAAREAKGLSQKELAERAGVKQPALSRFEKYDWSNYRFDFAAALVAGLDMHINVELTPWEEVRAFHGPAF